MGNASSMWTPGDMQICHDYVSSNPLIWASCTAQAALTEMTHLQGRRRRWHSPMTGSRRQLLIWSCKLLWSISAQPAGAAGLEYINPLFRCPCGTVAAAMLSCFCLTTYWQAYHSCWHLECAALQLCLPCWRENSISSTTLKCLAKTTSKILESIWLLPPTLIIRVLPASQNFEAIHVTWGLPASLPLRQQHS